MKYIDEFRNKNLVQRLADKIKAIMPAAGEINIMEVCGTHTQSFLRFGLDKLLPKNLKLIAGPGCPVCVSTQAYIDYAIACAQDKDVIILTFGDMLRVPGSQTTLEKVRAEGRDIRVVYSPLDSLQVAAQEAQKKVIFLAVGFETTAPTIALSLLQAKKIKLKNLSFLSSLKLIPPAMAQLLKDRRLKLNGFLCPGHVSVIIGEKPYAFIPKRYRIGCCIAGFEPLDILEGIYLLLVQISRKRPALQNQYLRAVTKNGNPRAQKIINKVFKTCAASWRGLGKIPHSGLEIRAEFSQFDAKKIFSISHKSQVTSRKLIDTGNIQRCRCAEVLKGLIKPDTCPLFRKICTPENPFGPCMVSQEGACNAYYRYQ